METDALSTVATVAEAVAKLSEASKALWDPLGDYFTSSESVEVAHAALNGPAEMLQSLKKDYENEVQICKTKVPSETFKQWIRKVEKIEDEVKKFEDKYKSKKSSRLSRGDLIKEMNKAGKQLGELWEEGLKIKDIVLSDPKLEPLMRKDAVPEIKKFETLQKPLEQILNLLNDDKVNRIGICGPLGTGKTTIMWNLNYHEEVAKKFEIIIWLKVSIEDSKKNLSTECLQEAIVQRLKIKTKVNSNSDEVEKKILMVLKGKRYLLLLDGVKEDLKLSQLGIPDCSNGSKLVLTTRLRHVCHSMVDKMINVTCLSPNEAWKMFKGVLQNKKLSDDYKIGPVARRVCVECCGLPLMIEKVANTFKLKNSECLWKDGLNSWRMWPEKECQGIREMYEMLKFCYDDLDDDWQKKCFLYGALYPEDNDIYTHYLLECWAAEGFLGNDRDATAKNFLGNEKIVVSGGIILSHLKNVSLLEESQNDDHVTMHKFIRQMALYIFEVDPECKYLVKTSRELQKPPDVKYWHEKSRISLGDNKFDQLPNSPNCSMLSTLFLQKNFVLKIIPRSFFKYMKKLRVLDLSYTGITSLPSLSMLTSLKVLYLNNCKYLVEMPYDIEKLKHLEALDIQGSGLNNIPPHIEKLTWLRRLRISFVSGNQNAAQEVHFNYETISKLSSLEELVIDVKSPGQWSNEVVENIIKEVATLKEFKTLKVCFPNKVVDVIEIVPPTIRVRVPNATILLSFIEKRSWENVHNIRSFYFFIGCENSECPEIPDFSKYKKYVKYCNGVDSNFPAPKALAEADAFELVHHNNIKQLSDNEIASMKMVRGCLIESCNTIETIMGTVGSASLPNLEHLYLKNLPELESIWKGPVQPGSLTKLMTLVLTSCQKLVEIFPPGVLQQLREIQYLKIEKCQEVQEIITESDNVGNLLGLPKLKKLVLLEMPNLSSICAMDSLDWPSLEKLNIFNCPSLRKLPFNKDSAAKLKSIKTEQNWWEALQWQNQEVKEQLQKLLTQSFGGRETR